MLTDKFSSEGIPWRPLDWFAYFYDKNSREVTSETTVSVSSSVSSILSNEGVTAESIFKILIESKLLTEAHIITKTPDDIIKFFLYNLTVAISFDYPEDKSKFIIGWITFVFDWNKLVNV